MRKLKKRILSAAVLIAVVLLAFYFFFGRKKKDDENNDIELGEVAQKTIVNSVSGTGTVESVNSVEVTSSLTGSSIKSINVKVGDVVSAGDVICTMNTSNEEEQIKSLKEQIAETRKQQENTRTAAEDARAQAEDTASEAAEQAAAANAATMQRLSSLNSQLAAAETELATAKTDLASAQINLESAQNNLAELSADLAAASDNDKPALMAQVQTATALVQTYQTDVQTKTMNVATKQYNYENIKGQIESINQAFAFSGTYGSAANGSNIFSEITAASGGASNTTIQLLNAQIKSLEDRISHATVTAPASGTITEIAGKEGSMYLGGRICLIEEAEALQVVSSVDEYDIPDVKVGMNAKIKTDATRDEELEGTVTFVSPKASKGAASSGSLTSLLGGMGSELDMSSLTSGSSAAYEVRISLQTPNDRLRLGMNAKISIVTESRENVLAVPFYSVQSDEKGDKFVTIVTEKKDDKGKKVYDQKDVKIITGLEGTNFVEVTDGDVKIGDKVLLLKQETKNSVQDLMNMMGSDAGI